MPVESTIIFSDIFNNVIGYDDVTALEAAAGDVVSWPVELYNSSEYLLNHLYIWINSTVQYIDISDDDATWITPKSQAWIRPSNALLLPGVAPAAVATFYMQRTIPAGTPSRSKVTNILHWDFIGSP